MTSPMPTGGKYVGVSLIHVRFVGSREIQSTRTNASPSPISGTASSVSSKVFGPMRPEGRSRRRNRRFRSDMSARYRTRQRRESYNATYVRHLGAPVPTSSTRLWFNDDWSRMRSGPSLLRAGRGVRHKTQLSQDASEIHNRPVLNDFPVANPVDRDPFSLN